MRMLFLMRSGPTRWRSDGWKVKRVIGLHIFVCEGCVTHVAYTHAVAVLQEALFLLDMGQGYYMLLFFGVGVRSLCHYCS